MAESERRVVYGDTHIVITNDDGKQYVESPCGLCGEAMLIADDDDVTVYNDGAGGLHALCQVCAKKYSIPAYGPFGFEWPPGVQEEGNS
jgi:hypothetical protein